MLNLPPNQKLIGRDIRLQISYDGMVMRLLRAAISVALLAAAFSPAGIQTVVSAPSRVPDILLIMPDQWRGDCLSVRGHPVVRTLNLDSLAREGALFRRAYSTCPSCIPARYSLLTGLFPSTSGVVGYAATPIRTPTLPQLLVKAGYTTALVGRYMHQVPENESYGYQKEIRGSTYVTDDDYDIFLRKAAPATGGIRALMQNLGVTANGWEAKPWPLKEELHPTTWAAQQARNLLTETSTEKPLFLTVSFFSPHPPLFPPPRYFEYYQKQNLPPPAHGDWIDWGSLSIKGDKNGHRVRLEGETLRATLSGYFGLMEHLDEQIGPLVADFKERSSRAGHSWVIVFTTDHGEMLGDHGFFRKCEPYEGSANIPFIMVASPQLHFKAGLRCDQPVCLEDVMPTLLEFAGAKCPSLDGVSLMPVLRGESKRIRTLLHSEHAPIYSKEQAFHALADGHFKYIWRPLDGSEHLFNLETDPHEEHDLARIKSPPAELKTWRDRLVKLLADRPEGFSDGHKLIVGRSYPALQIKARN